MYCETNIGYMLVPKRVAGPLPQNGIKNTVPMGTQNQLGGQLGDVG